MARLSAVEPLIRINRIEADICGVVHTVSLIPEILAHERLELFSLLLVVLSLSLVTESAEYVFYSTELLVHKTVEVDGRGRAKGTVEDRGIIVYADRGVVEEAIKTGLAVTELILVALHKALESSYVLLLKPGGIVTRHLKDKGEVLSETGLMYILAGSEEGYLLIGVDEYGHLAVLISMLKEVQNTASLILYEVLAGLTVVYDDLSYSHVGEPGIPVPKLKGIGRAGNDEGVTKIARRLTCNELVRSLRIIFYNSRILFHLFSYAYAFVLICMSLRVKTYGSLHRFCFFIWFIIKL